MNTTKRLRPQIGSASDQPITAEWQKRFKTLSGCTRIVAALLIALCAGYADELTRPGETIDAGDSYRLKDGSRVALHRLLHEVAIDTRGRFASERGLAPESSPRI